MKKIEPLQWTKEQVEEKILANMRTIHGEKYYWDGLQLMVTYKELCFLTHEIRIFEEPVRLNYRGQPIEVVESKA